MSRIENAEKNAVVEKAPQNLKGESNTAEGLEIIRQEELRRANQHNGDLPSVEIFGGELGKRTADADKRSGVVGDGDGKTPSITRAELDKAIAHKMGRKGRASGDCSRLFQLRAAS